MWQCEAVRVSGLQCDKVCRLFCISDAEILSGKRIIDCSVNLVWRAHRSLSRQLLSRWHSLLPRLSFPRFVSLIGFRSPSLPPSEALSGYLSSPPPACSFSFFLPENILLSLRLSVCLFATPETRGGSTSCTPPSKSKISAVCRGRGGPLQCSPAVMITLSVEKGKTTTPTSVLRQKGKRFNLIFSIFACTVTKSEDCRSLYTQLCSACALKSALDSHLLPH